MSPLNTDELKAAIADIERDIERRGLKTYTECYVAPLEKILAAARELIEVRERENLGFNSNCAYCEKPIQPLHGNPGLWGLVFTHPDRTGIPKVHHVKCVQERLRQLETATEARLEAERRLEDSLNALEKEITKRIEAENEIKRLKQFHREDIRVTNDSADYHIKECQTLQQRILALEAVNGGLREALKGLLGACCHEAEGTQRALAAIAAREALTQTPDAALGQLARLKAELVGIQHLLSITPHDRLATPLLIGRIDNLSAALNELGQL